jgi:hypothetical protein
LYGGVDVDDTDTVVSTIIASPAFALAPAATVAASAASSTSIIMRLPLCAVVVDVVVVVVDVVVVVVVVVTVASMPLCVVSLAARLFCSAVSHALRCAACKDATIVVGVNRCRSAAMN